MVKNILITRPKMDSDILSKELRSIGFIPTQSPVIEVNYLNPDLPKLNDFSYVIFSSKNGIRAYAQKFPDRNLGIFVVGEGSAEEAYKQGFKRIVVGQGNSDDLCKQIKSKIKKRDSKLLYVSGAYRENNNFTDLKKLGYNIKKLVLYKVIPVSNFPEGVLNKIENGIIDSVLFFSPRSAEAFSNLITKVGKNDITRETRVFCISKKIAQKASEINWKMIYISANSSKRSLIELLKYSNS